MYRHRLSPTYPLTPPPPPLTLTVLSNISFMRSESPEKASIVFSNWWSSRIWDFTDRCWRIRELRQKAFWQLLAVTVNVHVNITQPIFLGSFGFVLGKSLVSTLLSTINLFHMYVSITVYACYQKYFYLSTQTFVGECGPRRVLNSFTKLSSHPMAARVSAMLFRNTLNWHIFTKEFPEKRLRTRQIIQKQILLHKYLK